jgi:hypothetical protein
MKINFLPALLKLSIYIQKMLHLESRTCAVHRAENLSKNERVEK